MKCTSSKLNVFWDGKDSEEERMTTTLEFLAVKSYGSSRHPCSRNLWCPCLDDCQWTNLYKTRFHSHERSLSFLCGTEAGLINLCSIPNLQFLSRAQLFSSTGSKCSPLYPGDVKMLPPACSDDQQSSNNMLPDVNSGEECLPVQDLWPHQELSSSLINKLVFTFHLFQLTPIFGVINHSIQLTPMFGILSHFSSTKTFLNPSSSSSNILLSACGGLCPCQLHLQALRQRTLRHQPRVFLGCRTEPPEGSNQFCLICACMNDFKNIEREITFYIACSM